MGVYYRCTNGRGLCEKRNYVKEEQINEELRKSLRQIKLPLDVVEWSRRELLATVNEDRELKAAQTTLLKKRYQDIERRLSKAYDQFLDGELDSELWEAKSKQWKDEKTEIRQQMSTIELDDESSKIEVLRLMELASKAPELFESMNPDEKREMLNLVLSNPQIKNGSLCYDFRFPFSNFVGVTTLDKWRGGRESTDQKYN